MDWSGGYVADINYSGHYYAELNPARLSLALLNSGYELPKIETACELGFGQGISVNIHAASQPETQWFGTDFLPSQAEFAQGLAKISGSKAVLKDESFAEFCSRDDLPNFDFICLHGIWSWVSDDNRAIIVDFLHRKLKPGGIAYISYNVLPGWAHAAPMRHLLKMHAEHLSPPATDSGAKVAAGLDFMGRLLELNPAYASVNPSIKSRFDALKEMNKTYLAHEYLNNSWNPMYFNEISDILSEAKLSFVCTGSYAELMDEIYLNEGQRAFLDELPNDALTQTMRDFMLNQQFRRDVWIKGGVRLAPAQSLERIRAQRVALICDVSTVEMEVELAGRKVSLQPEIYRPLLDLMADNQPHQIGQMMDQLASKGIEPLQVVQALIVLIGANCVAPAQDPLVAKAASAMVRRYNNEILKRSRHSIVGGCLASVHLGGGLAVDQLILRMLDYVNNGAKTAPEIAQMVWAEFKSQGRVVLRSGKALETDLENLEELTARADEFLKEQKLRFENLGILLGNSSKAQRT